MPVISEQEMLTVLYSAKSVALIEPPYRRKYVPPGLAKIASLVRSNGGTVSFGRGPQGEQADLIAITSLFTYDSQAVISTIHQARFLSPGVPILVGGVYATLLTRHLQEHAPDDVMIFKGYSKELDSFVPDYSLDWGVQEPWDEFSFVFTSRGCPNRCPYCAVWRIEQDYWINPNWRDQIAPKPFTMVQDNNLSSAPEEHLYAVLDYLRSRDGVVIDGGMDCKYMTPRLAGELAKLRFTRAGMRLSFDRIEEDGTLQNAVRMLLDAGISSSDIMVLTIFNFHDTPKEADYRMREIANLGVRPYPQQYTPLNWTDRSRTYIGRHWTPNLVRTFRNYWILPTYKTASFESHVPDIPLEQEDWDAWYAGREDTKPEGVPVIIRRRGHVRMLAEHMKRELEALPEKDIFDQSADGVKERLRGMIEELEGVWHGEPVDPDTEVGHWLTDTCSRLGEPYGVG